jgi:hypothetical protein
VYWAFQGQPPARPPLSPAQKRDSAMIAMRIAKVIDSLVAGGANRATLEELRNNLLSGNLGGGFGGGGGGGGGGGFGGGAGGQPGLPAFVARPAEGNVIGGAAAGALAAAGAEGAAGGGGGGGGGGGFGGNPLIQALGGFQALQGLLPGGGGFGGGGFGGGGGPVVEPGEYKVVLEIGGQKLTRIVKVRKADRIW